MPSFSQKNMAVLLAALALNPPWPSPETATWAMEDWQAWVTTAARQGLAPLLYRRICDNHWPIPELILTTLRRQYLHCAAENTRRFAELGEILHTLGALDIPVILLKGAHLAPWVYENVALRPMADLDLLIHPKDLTRALQALITKGYSLIEGEAWMGRLYGHYALRHLDGHLVELHYRIGSMGIKAHIDHAGIWQRAKAVMLDGQRAWVMEPTDLVLYLCTHIASQHLFGMGLLPLCDIQQTFAHDGMAIVPQTLVERAVAWRIARGTYLALRLAQEMLRAPIPPEILKRLAPADGDRYAQMATTALMMGDASQPPSSNLVALWADRSWRARLGRLGRILIPTKDRMRAFYNLPPDQSISPWLYVRRWEDLLLRRGRSLRQLTGQSQEPIPWKDLIQWLANG